MNENKLDYQKYSSYSRDEIIAKMKKVLKHERFEHCLRVEQVAIDLARENEFDETVAGLAGLVHDYAKQRSSNDFEKAIYEYHLDLDLLNYGKSIWHGYVGYLFVQHELGINDVRILNAVKYHTIGAPDMGICAQIVYMADYIEPNRTFAGVEEARRLTHDNLWRGVVYQNQNTMDFLIKKGKAIYPAAVIAYNSIVAGIK
ncbi:HD domain-containing protein [Fructilactobacillus lindneri]|uniref:bis(5'-nucleosyl)-tetraphosphatase (symmetrical) n=2 Tax=Fructilactobacillus lindneri TaxID=53444 RepID=A0A0R2JPR8_9LACO|nr:bis(5'-nucleosyl)-tetraphosphatase (symmetrical) YqeK [Fructilactobacillus lindneri]ANZ58262.1 HD domain-containing protein [Fructilactobacillus lindneri]ANZ59584.1 HD domain-containing protein [Fructilactobacillus lindneri]KRN79089.1 hypothetical protein IV52_GL000494 [Fructilactobacillus lindneri DSM 20690 = JCM 11027]POG98632.1 HD domain-containing protein [Fructilactobacillus lindneri]POH04020.1 HD domain-containing protein [Fructilactobacillus lindneri]